MNVIWNCSSFTIHEYHFLKQCLRASFIRSHLQDVDEDVLLRLLGTANIFQHDGVVDTLGVRLVQVIGVWLVPLLEGEEDLVLVRTHYLNILEAEVEGWGRERGQGEVGKRKETSVFSESLELRLKGREPLIMIHHESWLD